MSSFSEYIASQFGNPHGPVGKICCMIMNRINRKMYGAAVSLLELNDGDNVLEIGYGNGQMLRLIYGRVKVNLYGIDISEDMMTQAEKRNKRAKSDGKLFLRVGDCCDLPYDDDFFHAIVTVNTVYFWEDTVKGLSEICRTLKKGSSFYNVVYTKEFMDRLSYTKNGFKKFEQEQFIEFGKQAGFEDITVKDIVKGKNFVVIYRK